MMKNKYFFLIEGYHYSLVTENKTVIIIGYNFRPVFYIWPVSLNEYLKIYIVKI